MLAMLANTSTIETIMRTTEQPGVVLYGMMGSGKTTLGKKLAGYLGFSFIDTDEIIETSSGKSCGELVKEGVFVSAQSDAILGFEPDSPIVIATGGSVAMYPDLVSHLGQFGTSVFIKPTANELKMRLSPGRIAALNNPDNLPFADLYNRRIDYYQRAARAILEIADGETPEQSVNNLISLVKATQ